MTSHPTRKSIKAFLAVAKARFVPDVSGNEDAFIVAGNESADLDSLTSALVYAYMRSYADCPDVKTRPLSFPLVNIPAEDLKLRPEFTALLKHADLDPSDLLTLDDFKRIKSEESSDGFESTRLVLVDHNAPTGALKDRFGRRVDGCIDHHDDEGVVPKDAEPRVITKAGSCSSLVVEAIREAWDELSPPSSRSMGAEEEEKVRRWDGQVARLALGSVLIDTRNLEDKSKVTAHDTKAVEYLEAKIRAAPGAAEWDRAAFFAEINDAKTDLDGLTVQECLRKDYKMWTEGDVKIGISVVVKGLEWLLDKAGSTDTALKDMREFSEERGLDVFALMTAYTGKHDEFRRDLLVWAFEGKGLRDKAEKFQKAAGDELGLEEWDGDAGNINRAEGDEFRHVWKQTKVQYSRKRVGPLLRHALK